MHSNNRIHVPSFTTDATDSNRPKHLYLNFLTADDISVCDSKRYMASKKLKNLYVFEIKGTFETDWQLDLPPHPARFWLVFQFIGNSERNTASHTALSDNEYRGFYGSDLPQQIQVQAGKTRLVLLGLKVKDTTSFATEWPLLAKPAIADQSYFSSMNIGYRAKQVFEKMEQYPASPYSLHSKINYHLCQLIDIYHRDLHDKAKALHKEDIIIYHEAVKYIQDRYMDEDINIDTIAEKLQISSRKLYRVFEDKHTSVHSAIQTIRLYKGREMLRETNMPVDGIAFQLNFSTAHYFYKQFVKRFGHSPSRERELRRKKKKR